MCCRPWQDFMKNIIELDIQFLSAVGSVTVLHNQSILNFDHDGKIVIEAQNLQSTNRLEIFSDVDVKLVRMSMFDLGSSKLAYLGQCFHDGEGYQSQEIPKGARWKLEYSAPVFTWLHKVLEHGWIVGP